MEHGGAHIAYRMEIVLSNSLPLLCKFPQGRCDHAVQSKGCLTALFAGKQNLDSGTHNGFWRDRPHRQSATVLRLIARTCPWSSRVLNDPRTRYGPPAWVVIETAPFCLAISNRSSARSPLRPVLRSPSTTPQSPAPGVRTNPRRPRTPPEERRAARPGRAPSCARNPGPGRRRRTG